MEKQMVEQSVFSVADFVSTFKATNDERALIAAEAEKYDFRYRRLDQTERDQVILSILLKIDSFTKVGSHRSTIWESCWSDAKQAFENARGNLDALDPAFMGAHPIVRLHGDYARPEDPKFETHWFRVMRRWLFSRYLTGASKVFEFGCGSGFNLATAAQMFPGISLMGLDWSPSAVNLVSQIGTTHGYDLSGRRFDFFNPDNEVPVDGDTVAMTFAALEQTGPDFVTFAEWLLARRPKLVVSMEPVLEFYDPSSLVDEMAIRYHTHRAYLNGYYTWVKAKEKERKVEIVSAHRPSFGSLYHEGYSIIVWKPVN